MKICPVCEGYASSAVTRCTTCEAPLVGAREVAWARRDGDTGAGNPWIGLVVAGKYRITGVLGKGGMGTVYRAVHEVSHSPVALKVLNPRFARHQDFKDKLIEEARKASLLGSEYVSRVIDVGETAEGAVFLAMELVEGETLFAWLGRAGPLEPWILVDLVAQLAAALEDAAEAGLVHRDLSPKNVMIEGRGDGFRAKVLDFGIARLRRSGDEPDGAGRWINPPYTAPEILRGEAGDARADLYSLGVIAYEALSGRLPHGGGTLEDRVRDVLETEAAPLVPATSAPRGMPRLIRRLIAKDPAARPSSAREVRDALQKMRRPHGLFFQVAAVAVFIAGATTFLAGLTVTRDPTLQSSSGSPLLLSARSQRGGRTQYVKVEDLRALRLQVGDVRQGELEVRGWVDDVPAALFDEPLGGTIHDGELRLDAGEQPQWRHVIELCANAGRPVSLDFQHVPTNRLIAFARVFVDRRPPRLVELEGVTSTLDLGMTLRARIDEDGRVARIEFRLVDGSRTLAAFTPPVPADGLLVTELGDRLLRGAVPGANLDGLARVQLLWSLTDAAGRQGGSGRMLDLVDLARPDIAAVTAPDGKDTLELDERHCRIRVKLARPERQLATLHVGTRGGEESRADVYPVAAAGSADSFVVRIAVPAAARDSRVDFSFWVVDRAGNESRHLEKEFGFRRIALDRNLALDGDQAGVARLGPEAGVLYVAADSRARLVYTCNPAYEPVPKPGPGIAVAGSGPGGCRVTVGPFAPGSEQTLVIEHHPENRSQPPVDSTEKLAIRAVSAAPSVRPAAAAAGAPVWTPEALRLGVLDPGKDRDSVRLGAKLPLRIPGDARATGTVWVERGDEWEPIRPPFALGSARDLRAVEIELGHGRNRIAVQATDCLGRGIVDETEAGRRGRHARAGGRDLVVVADLRHDTTPPEAHDVSVEFGVDATLVIDDDEPFARGTVKVEYDTLRFDAALEGRSGRTRCVFHLPFDSVREICGWTGIGSAPEFVDAKPRRPRLEFVTPAGRWEVAPEFRPTETLLRPLDLAALRAKGSPAIRHIRMVPFLAPPPGRAVDLGPPAGVRAKGSLELVHRVPVTGIDPFFLASREISRAAWAAFVDDVAAHAQEATFPREALRHHEDPLAAAERLSRTGLAPDLTVFGGRTFAQVAAGAGAGRPITGVNYYQAYAFTRWLGLRAFGDPELFRLPFGAELEWAALGAENLGDRRPRLNGLDAAGAATIAVVRSRFRALQQHARHGDSVDPLIWPASMAELAAIGDFVRSRDGDRVYGLDFGVREWVEDLPLIDVDEAYRLIAASHRSHVAYARERATGKNLRIRVTSRLENGEVRGLGWGEPPAGGDVDPVDYLVDCYGDAGLRGLLGVKRMNYVRRDGRGLLAGWTSSLVPVTGFRVAGGAAFLERARAENR